MGEKVWKRERGKRCDPILIDGRGRAEGRFPHSLHIHGAVTAAREREGERESRSFPPSLSRALCWHLGTRGVRRSTTEFSRFRRQEGQKAVAPLLSVLERASERAGGREREFVSLNGCHSARDEARQSDSCPQMGACLAMTGCTLRLTRGQWP